MEPAPVPVLSLLVRVSVLAAVSALSCAALRVPPDHVKDGAAWVTLWLSERSASAKARLPEALSAEVDPVSPVRSLMAPVAVVAPAVMGGGRVVGGGGGGNLV